MPPYKATRSSDSTKGVMEASIEHDKHSPELGTQERHALPQAVSDFLLKPGTHTTPIIVPNPLVGMPSVKTVQQIYKTLNEFSKPSMNLQNPQRICKTLNEFAKPSTNLQNPKGKMTLRS